MDRSYDAIIFIIKYLILRRPRVAIFAGIIKIVSMFFKTFLNTQKMLKELEIMYRNAIYICSSWYSTIFRFPVKNADVSRTPGLFHVINIFFGSSLGKV